MVEYGLCLSEALTKEMTGRMTPDPVSLFAAFKNRPEESSWPLKENKTLKRSKLPVPFIHPAEYLYIEQSSTHRKDVRVEVDMRR